MSELRPRSNGSRTIPGIARHGRLRKSGPVAAILSIIAIIAVVAVASTAAVAGIVGLQLKSQVHSVTIAGDSGTPPDIGALKGGFNILIVGSDTRVGQNGIGGTDGGVLNDVTLLLHVSQDHTNAIAVSFPRDMVVPMPACSKGGPAAALPINNTLSYGGLPCTVLTVQALTGLKIQYAGLITFTGVIAMANAVGGVTVCVNKPIHDVDTGLNIKKAGNVTLKGFQALAFLRSRHGVGDGSDLGRISSQQVYLSSLVRKLKSQGTLSNIPTLYNLAEAATRHMTLSQNFQSIPTMIAIAQALKDIPLANINFVQYPGSTGGSGVYTGKVQPDMALGGRLFALIKSDTPIKLGVTVSRGSMTAKKQPTAAPSTGTPAPTSTPAPSAGKATKLDGLTGQSAATYTCSKAFGT
ncbi:MAG: LytR family transcriptional regulator [Glaciihabitans sp.]|nr:LytR family transcriptional regulator [Glaciihabitans sp.]